MEMDKMPPLPAEPAEKKEKRKYDVTKEIEFMSMDEIIYTIWNGKVRINILLG